MKKLAIVLFAIALSSSAFAADDVVSLTKPVVKGTGTVVKHVAVDAYAVGKTAVKDTYSVGKYITVGAVKGTKGLFTQLKHAVKK